MLKPLRMIAAAALAASIGAPAWSAASDSSDPDNPPAETAPVAAPDTTAASPVVLVDPVPPADDPAPAADAESGDDSGVERSTEDCPEGFEGTHGQFVSQAEDKRAAAKSRCGMPAHSKGKTRGDDAAEGASESKAKKAKKVKKDAALSSSSEDDDGGDDAAADDDTDDTDTDTGDTATDTTDAEDTTAGG